MAFNEAFTFLNFDAMVHRVLQGVALEGATTLLHFSSCSGPFTINTKIFAIQKKFLRGINFIKITKNISSPRDFPRSAWELQKKSVAATNSRKNYKKKYKKKPAGH